MDRLAAEARVALFGDDLLTTDGKARFHMASHEPLAVLDTRDDVLIIWIDDLPPDGQMTGVVDQVCAASATSRDFYRRHASAGELEQGHVCILIGHHGLPLCSCDHDHELYHSRATHVPKTTAPTGSTSKFSDLVIEDPPPWVGRAAAMEALRPVPVSQLKLPTIPTLRIDSCSGVLEALVSGGPTTGLGYWQEKAFLAKGMSVMKGRRFILPRPRSTREDPDRQVRVLAPARLSLASCENLITTLAIAYSKIGTTVEGNEGTFAVMCVPLHRNGCVKNTDRTQYLVGVTGGHCRHSRGGPVATHFMVMDGRKITMITQEDVSTSLALAQLHDSNGARGPVGAPRSLDMHYLPTDDVSHDLFWIMVHVLSCNRWSQVTQELAFRHFHSTHVLGNGPVDKLEECVDLLQSGSGSVYCRTDLAAGLVMTVTWLRKAWAPSPTQP